MSVKRTIKKLTPKFLLDGYFWLWAFAGAVVCQFPSRKLMVIGVTGTSGKSTTVDFITKILEEAGNKVVSNSSIRFKVADKEWPNELKMGMPGRFFMQNLLKQGVDAGCNYAVLEVTSEGIRQFRHALIDFKTAVFTNLTPEHIESHGGFENYRNEKLKLFKATKNTHIVNADDENAKYFLNVPAQRKTTFGIDKEASVEAEHIARDNGLKFSVRDTVFTMNLLGGFNIYNALAAISVALSEDISLDICKKVLERVSGIPGRMEIVAKDPLVVVDYAHTPEQLELAYKSFGQKKLVCVLGSCGGGRDKWKRPVLGKIAQHYCRDIIVTDEDPYDEDPLEIMEQVAGGIDSQVKPYRIILDRKEAIHKALEAAGPQDVVVITGKGSENLMCLAHGKKIPWDDRQIVRDALVK